MSAIRKWFSGLLKRDALLYGVATIVVGAVLFELSRVLKNDSNRDLYGFILFTVGVGTSFLFGKLSVRSSAKEMLKPHAKSAVNRLSSLAAGASDLVELTNEQRDRAEQAAFTGDANRLVDIECVIGMHETVQMQLRNQIRTAADAVEDWRDFIPQEVSDVQERGVTDGD